VGNPVALMVPDKEDIVDLSDQAGWHHSGSSNLVSMVLYVNAINSV